MVRNDFLLFPMFPTSLLFRGKGKETVRNCGPQNLWNMRIRLTKNSQKRTKTIGIDHAAMCPTTEIMIHRTHVMLSKKRESARDSLYMCRAGLSSQLSVWGQLLPEHLLTAHDDDAAL